MHLLLFREFHIIFGEWDLGIYNLALFGISNGAWEFNLLFSV
jgi:hypothetical protein